MYLESVAMVPQLYMFQKQASSEGGEVEVSHPDTHTHTHSYTCALLRRSIVLIPRSLGPDQPHGVRTGNLASV